MSKSFLQECFEKEELNPFSYSGKSMYGKECLAVSVNNVGDVFATIFEHSIEYNPYSVSGIEIEETSKGISNFRTDSLGLKTVVYFPGVQFIEDEDESKSEDE